jgi:hypothetical protein
MKLRHALAGIVLPVLALTLCVTALCSRTGNTITYEAYQQIQVGMSRQQVEEILGGPARNESGVRIIFIGEATSMSTCSPEEWCGPSIRIHVTFDAQGRACEKGFCMVRYEGEPSFLDRLRSWLPW